MTASSIFVGQGEACILADTAWFDAQGRVVTFQSKIYTAPHLRAAVAHAGLTSLEIAARIAEWIHTSPDEDQLIAAAPQLLELIATHVEASIDRRYDPRQPPNRGQQLLIALWSPSRMRAQGYILVDRPGCAPVEIEIGVCHRVRGYVWPHVESSALPRGFDPTQHGRELLTAQRATKTDYGWSSVGGSGECVRVSVDRAERRTICRWVDAIGLPCMAMMQEGGVSE